MHSRGVAMTARAAHRLDVVVRRRPMTPIRRYVLEQDRTQARVRDWFVWVIFTVVMFVVEAAWIGLLVLGMRNS
jgi:hypothetical protein